jgi:hypothetical protein
MTPYTPLDELAVSTGTLVTCCDTTQCHRPENRILIIEKMDSSITFTFCIVTGVESGLLSQYSDEAIGWMIKQSRFDSR